MSTSSTAAAVPTFSSTSSSGADCEVTLLDQKLINRFARLNAKCEELSADLAEKSRQLENTCEALNELVLQDQHVLIHAGEVFARMTADSANDWCEDMKSQLEAEVRRLEAQVEVLRTEMAQIKATLYAKFGSNINLEYDED